MKRFKSLRPVIVRARFQTNDQASVATQELNRLIDDVQQKLQDLFKEKDGIAESYDVEAVYSLIGVETEVGWESPPSFMARDSEVFWEIPPYTCIEDVEDLFIAAGAETVVLEENMQNEEHWKSLLPTYLKDELDNARNDEQDDDEDRIEFFTRVVH